MDNVYNPREEALRKLRAHRAVMTLIELLVRSETQLFNASMLIEESKITGVMAKTISDFGKSHIAHDGIEALMDLIDATTNDEYGLYNDLRVVLLDSEKNDDIVRL